MSSTATTLNSALSVKISQEKFNQALSLVSRAVAKHSIQPVLGNVLLKTDKENQSLWLIGTDLDLALSMSIPAEIIEDGEVTIPAQKLSEVISKLPHLELSLTSSETALINVVCGRSKFEIKGLPADQFPREFVERAFTNTEDTFSLPVKHIQKASQLVSFASDKKEANSILNGICLELSKERGLELAATDGSRLAYYKLDEMNLPDDFESKKVIIPYRSITELSKMMSGTNEEYLECSLNDSNQVIFKIGNRTICSSLIEGNYPKYQQLIPTNHSQIATLERQLFTSALERVSVLANEKTRVVKVLFEESGVLNISANTPDLGEAQDQIDMIDYTGEDFSIAFNVNYMNECLKSLSYAKLEIKMSEPLKPIIISPIMDNNLEASVDDDENDRKDKNTEDEVKSFNYIYLLMPVQMRS